MPAFLGAEQGNTSVTAHHLPGNGSNRFSRRRYLQRLMEDNEQGLADALAEQEQYRFVWSYKKGAPSDDSIPWPA
jgi:hypothetical protein